MVSLYPARKARPQAAAPFRTGLTLAGLVFVAAGLRLVALDTHPWGLHVDQVGIARDGLDLVRGQLTFPATYNTWLHAAQVAVLGASPVAVRVLPALVGSLFPLSVFLALRGLFGERTALLAAALGAVALWPVGLSRSGFSISYLPVVLALCLWQIVAGWQTGRARHWLAGGALLALAQYIYYPARILIIVLGLAVVYVLLYGPRQRLRPALWALPPFILGSMSLFFQPAQFAAESSRYNTVFLFAHEYNSNQPLVALARQVWYAFAMFFVEGDLIYRHNVARQPVYNALVAMAAVIGLALIVRRWQRPQHLLWFTWMAGMLAPMLLSIESPHFFRAVGVLPMAFVPPALGLDLALRQAEQRRRRGLGLAGLAGVLLFSLAHTVYTYFGPRYRGTPELYEAFMGRNMDLAVSINQFLGAGWQGHGWRVTDITPEPGLMVVMDPAVLLDETRRDTVRFIVPLGLDRSPAYRSLAAALQMPPEEAAAFHSVRLFVAPGHEQPGVSLLPTHRLIRVQDAPRTRTEQANGEDPPYRMYTSESLPPLPALPVACFPEGMTLRQTTTQVHPGAIQLSLLWSADERPTFDYTVFVHLVAQGAVVSQVDAYPVNGRYLTSWWRPGDLIADDYQLTVPPDITLTGAYLRVGLYRWDTVVNLPVTDCAGTALGDFVVLPLATAP